MQLPRNVHSHEAQTSQGFLCQIPYGLSEIKSSNVNRTASDQGLYPYEFNTGIAMEYGNNDIS